MSKDWDIDFISRDDFKSHVEKTIKKYIENFQAMDVTTFNKNVVDPIKMLFDKSIYHKTWETIINEEIARQRDKSNMNGIGYFHQNIFSYIKNCEVPPNGSGGFDVIYTVKDKIQIPDDTDTVSSIYVEMKNKHNTMNSASASDTYKKMKDKILDDDDCYCALVEVIANHSQNIKWKQKDKTTGKTSEHKRIRRMSIDKFYEIVTGDKDGFYKICMALPSIIDELLIELKSELHTPEDSVIPDLQQMATNKGIEDKTSDDAYLISVFLLGFDEYNGFHDEDNDNK